MVTLDGMPGLAAAGAGAVGSGRAGVADMGANPNARTTNSPLRFSVIFPVERMPASAPKLFL